MTITDLQPGRPAGASGAIVHSYLALRYVLTESLVVRSGYDPLRITTDHVVNGRAQRGMLAAALRHAGRDDLVEPWIARGTAIRFAPAFPRLEDPGGAAATVPAPRCWHVHTPPGHTAPLLADLLAAPAAPGTAYRALGGLVTPDLTRRAVPRTRTEQYLGVARRDAGRHGVPYLTTSLEPGQVFEARWQLSAASAEELADLAARVLDVLAAADGLLSLGSGGTRAHGGGIRVTAALGAAAPLTPDRIDSGRRDWPAGELRDLLLLAPALVDDHLGRPAPAALTAAATRALAAVLGPGAAEPVGAHIQQEAVGAYHRLYQGPMAEQWAAAPGSVVRLRALRTITLEQIRAVEARPLGRRAADGHGVAVLLPVAAPGPVPADHAPLARTDTPGTGDTARTTDHPPHPPAAVEPPGPERTELRTRPVALADGSPVRVDPAWVAAEAAADPARSPVARLQDTLLTRAAADLVRARARDLARRSARLPPAPLLGRLREVAADPGADPRAVLARLAGVVTGDPDRAAPHTPLPEPARADLAATSVPHGDTELPLPQWLDSAAGDPRAWWRHAGPDPADLAAALAPVDLTWRPGAEGAPGAAARAWSERPDVRARLSAQLIGYWLAAAAWIGRDTGQREDTR
ncbi:hypothetical protein LG943_18945 [Streptomonospora sp. S1-112]|uniref:Uncharacterized protein n=1 Tax=Streptomonospora mangrovi TaxID=2883123 RepID=A0A9X3NXX3_9ACTN|nr:hypothetical protein [Streptomonospora mangrovi]MDA0566376.1 hypothetical protein [Streptomonospora mangrovi]